jgi:hypothetical protein
MLEQSQVTGSEFPVLPFLDPPAEIAEPTEVPEPVQVPEPVPIQPTPLAVARFLRNRTKRNFAQIMRLCVGGCHGLFLPIKPGEEKNEGRRDFIEMWLVKKIRPLLKLDRAETITWAKSGVADYWSLQCRLALMQQIKRQIKRRVKEVSLDATVRGLPFMGLWASDGSIGSSMNDGIPETKLTPEELTAYIDENLPVFLALGKMGDVLIAVLKAFPADNITRSIAEAMNVTERQALRYREDLIPVLLKEIAAGNTVIRGLFSLLRNGKSDLPEHRRQWDNGPYMAFSPTTPRKRTDGDKD